MNSIFDAFAHGRIFCGRESVPAESLGWSEHGDFAGVFLKNMLVGEQTDGLVSCHLVRIDPNKAIGLHSHADSIELHEVIAGGGACITENGTLPYTPGTMSVIARTLPHEVHAGEDGLYLFAKFISRKP